jgi:hypothetical protein
MTNPTFTLPTGERVWASNPKKHYTPGMAVLLNPKADFISVTVNGHKFPTFSQEDAIQMEDQSGYGPNHPNDCRMSCRSIRYSVLVATFGLDQSDPD